MVAHAAATTWAPRALDDPTADDAEEAITPPTLEARVRERFAIAREQWTMTTFYLFDAQSWR
jgi:hypothetical protein